MTSTAPDSTPSANRPPARRRLAAVVSLLLGGAAVLAVAAFPFRHFPEGLLAAVATVLGFGLAWLALIRRGVMRWLGLAVAVALFACAAVLLIGDGAVLWLLAFVALGAGSLAVGRVALGADRRSLRAAPTPGLPVPPASHPALIINPWSGDGTMERTGLLAAARERGIDTVVLAKGDDLRELAVSALDRGADVIGMAGGDGSQALVASVAAERDVPYVCIPAGTRNHLALDLGVDRTDVIGALDAFRDGVERRIDLATVNGRVFVNNVSLGVYANIVQSEGYREAKLGTTVRLLPDMLGPDAEPFDLRFRGPDGTEHDSAHVILVSNNPYSLDRLGGFGSRPTISSGKLGIVVTAILAPGEPAGQGDGPAATGGQRPRRMEWTATGFDVGSGAPVYAGVDGEALTLDPPVRFAIMPGALRVRVAKSHPGVSPAAVQVELAGSRLTRLTGIALGHDPA